MSFGQKYTQGDVGSYLPVRSAFHRWNVWRTYQGMKGDPTYREPETAYADHS